MLEIGTLSSCLMFDLESSKLEFKFHIQTFTDLANRALEMLNLITRTRPTVGSPYASLYALVRTAF